MKLPDSAFVLSASLGSFKPGGAVTIDANGQPHRRYVKDIIHVGEYVKVKGDERQTISATPEQLAHWATETNRLIAAGNPVSVPPSHEQWGDAMANLGSVTEMFVEDDKLYGVFDLIGDHAIAAASKGNVSLYSEPEFADGKGAKFTWPIRHVAMTTRPVIPSLGGFIPIAASHGTIQAPLFTEATMFDWKPIKDKLGIDADLTDANATEAISAAFEAVKPRKGTAKELADARAECEKLKEENTSLKSSLPVELSHTERGMAGRLIDNEIEARVKAGNITPVVASALKPLLKGSNMMLSFGDGGRDPFAIGILDALKGNDPVKLGEQTGRQVIELAQRGKDETADDEFVKKQAAEAAEWRKANK